jgi:LPS export ABC transporter protein LptC
MAIKHKHITLHLVTVLAVTLCLRCTDNFKKIQQVGVLQNEPVGVAKDINLKYTDSGMLTANLISKTMLDYSNRSFGFSEFPDGIHLILYDKEQNKSTVTSDYAIYYTETDVIDIRGNVKVATSQNDTLYTEQLFYFEKDEWVFTNQPFRLKSPSGNTYGNGFDSDVDFKRVNILEMYDSEFELEGDN